MQANADGLDIDKSVKTVKMGKC